MRRLALDPLPTALFRVCGRHGPPERGGLMLPHHRHVCRECGHATTYHVHDHESEGDEVTAYCESCGEDGPHLIRGRVA